jgi:hypothetical protein
MVIIVTGGRSYSNWDKLDGELKAINPDMIIQGGAGGYDANGCPSGADLMAEEWAREHQVPCLWYPAKWDTYGLSAGPKRNQAMVDLKLATMCLAFPGGAGTADCVRRCRAAGLLVREIK